MRLQIDPEQGAELRFEVKVPGPEMRLGRATMAFRYGDIFPERPYVGYETLLYDCMVGDATLFQRADNIEAGWAAVQPLLDAWRSGEPSSTLPAAQDRPARTHSSSAMGGPGFPWPVSKAQEHGGGAILAGAGPMPWRRA